MESTPRASASQWHSICPSLRTFLASHKVPHSVRRAVASHPVEQYTEPSTVCVFAGTYNVNGRAPASNLDLHPWLHDAADADVVVIGFQEIVPLNTSNIVMGADSTSARHWVSFVQQYLSTHPSTRTDHNTLRHPSHTSSSEDGQGGKSGGGGGRARGWVLVATKQMVGVFVAVWVRKGLAGEVQGVQSLSIPTGVMGLFGNKGAVAIRMRIAETGVLFIASHLSSGDKPGDDTKRNADYATIAQRLVFPVDDVMVGDVEVARQLRAVWGGVGVQSVVHHDHVVWLGDLNYRLRGVADAAVRTAITEGRFDTLLVHHDELRWAQKTGQAFGGWQEGDIRFPPTYKFHRGTDRYIGASDPPSTTSSVASDLYALQSSGVVQGGALAPGAVIAALDVTQRGITGQLKTPPYTNNTRTHTTTPTPPTHTTTTSPSPSPSPSLAVPDKIRTPAWCDRILWTSKAMNAPGAPVDFTPTLLSYNSAPLYVSDHKPVHATLSLGILRFDETRALGLLTAAQHVADLEEMAAVPHCQLVEPLVQLGILQYNVACPMTVIVQNTGTVPATITLVPQPITVFGQHDDEQPIMTLDTTPPRRRSSDTTPTVSPATHPNTTSTPPTVKTTPPTKKSTPATSIASPVSPRGDPRMEEVPCWLTPPPDMPVTLNAGDAMPLEFVACVGGKTGAAQLAVEHTLDAVLLLRVQGGNDMFLAVEASYMPSFVGLMPDVLLSLPRPLHGAPAIPSDSNAPVHPRHPSTQPQYRGDVGSSDDRGDVGSSVDRGNVGSSDDRGNDAPTSPLAGGAVDGGSLLEGGHLWGHAVVEDVPQELLHLLTFLRGHLSTPGLFLSSSALLPLLMAPRAAVESGAAAQDPAVCAVWQLQDVLDTGGGVPQGTDPHTAASLLLLYFASLPQPLLPRGIAKFCDHCNLQRAAAMTLLNAITKPAALATFWASIALFQDALQPVHGNSLTTPALASMLAELWLDPMPHTATTGRASSQAAVLAQAALRRMQFLMMILDGTEEASLL